MLPWLGVGSKSDRLGWPLGRVDLYVRAPWKCVEFCLGMDKTAKCLRVRIRGQIRTGDIVCCGLPDQEEVADDPLRQL